MNDFYKGVNTMISLFFLNHPLNTLFHSGKYLVCIENLFEHDIIDQLPMGTGCSL